MILMVKMVGVSLSTVSIKYSLRMCRVFLVKYNQSHTIHQRHTLIPYTTSSQNNMCLFFLAMSHDLKLYHFEILNLNLKIISAFSNDSANYLLEMVHNYTGFHLFGFSPLCVFKCLLKFPACEDAKSHWLHLFDFSPLCFFKCLLKLPA